MAQSNLKDELVDSLRNQYLNDLKANHNTGAISIKIKAPKTGQKQLGVGTSRGRSKRFFKCFRTPYFCKEDVHTVCHSIIMVKNLSRNNSESNKTKLFWQIKVSLVASGRGTDIEDFLSAEETKILKIVEGAFCKSRYIILLSKSEKEVISSERPKRYVI